MRGRIYWSTILLAASPMIAGTGARADGGYKRCAIGDRVVDQQGRAGIVVDVTDAATGDTSGTYCHVDLDGGARRQYYIAWMLHRAGAPRVDPRQVARIVPGRYGCYAGNPTHYTFVDIVVTGPGSYSDNRGHAGSFTYAPATQRIVFASGPFAGSYSKYLENHRIGLSTRPGDFFATTCELQTGR